MFGNGTNWQELQFYWAGRHFFIVYNWMKKSVKRIVLQNFVIMMRVHLSRTGKVKKYRESQYYVTTQIV